LLLPQSPHAGAILLDDTPPAITISIDGTGGTNGWYRGDNGGNYVVVHWTVKDPESSITSSTGCEAAIQIPGPNAGITKTCSATSAGGTNTQTTKLLKIDATPPVVTAAATRVPDANGWYNKPVSVAFKGTDATSGLASCTTANYAGPDSGTAPVSGTCTDKAGNVGAGRLVLSYDSTPPSITKVGFKSGNRAVSLQWQVSVDTARVEVTRAGGKSDASLATVYKGSARAFRDKGLRVGTHYRYTISAFDHAANVVRKTVKVTATGALFSPAPGERVTRAPRLVWAPVAGASYYNVLVMRGGRTVFSAWPSATSIALPRAWKYRGRANRLRKGVYRWFVWPGFGAQSASHYGRMLGQSSFLFAR
jgi:hypothetical protein